MEETARLAEIRFASRPDQLPEVRSVVRKALKTRGYVPDVSNCIVLAIDEACANIIKHAYGERLTGDIVLEILSNSSETIFRLTDFAPSVDKKTIRSRDLEDVRPGGLGVHFIHEVMDEVEFLEPPEGIGNILEMRKKLPRHRE